MKVERVRVCDQPYTECLSMQMLSSVYWKTNQINKEKRDLQNAFNDMILITLSVYCTYLNYVFRAKKPTSLRFI